MLRFNKDMDGEMEPEDDGRWVRYDDVASLESQLAAAERTIGELKHRIGEIEDERGATIAELRDEIEKLGAGITVLEDSAEKAEAERDEARRVAVKAAKFGCGLQLSALQSGVDLRVGNGHLYPVNENDDSSIYAALRRAMGEGE